MKILQLSDKNFNIAFTKILQQAITNTLKIESKKYQQRNRSYKVEQNENFKTE